MVAPPPFDGARSSSSSGSNKRNITNSSNKRNDNSMNLGVLWVLLLCESAFCVNNFCHICLFSGVAVGGDQHLVSRVLLSGFVRLHHVSLASE